MRIELSHDRTDHHPDHYVDPVIAKEGVFAVLEPEDLSEAEQKRANQHEERINNKQRQTRARRQWLPADLLKRVTNLYARFRKP